MNPAPASPQPDDFRELLAPLDSDDSWLDVLRSAEGSLNVARAIGDYDILDEIRQGGQAIVFRARHRPTQRIVALKRTAYGAFSTPAELRRFEHEVDAVLSLQHPGIVTVYGLETVDGVDVLAMEWVDGATLDAWSAEQSGQPDAQRTRLDAFLQICDAVQHAHQRGVIHRDLKPSNILVDSDDRCRVLDFGLARFVDDDEASTSAAAAATTRTIGFVGTPAYAPPEHFASDGALSPVDLRSDVYALGVVLYQLMTARRPFEAGSLSAMIQQIETEDAVRPSKIDSALPRDLDAVVAQAMAKRAQDRYASVDALAHDVRSILNGRPVRALPPRFGYLASRWIQRNRLVFGLMTAIVALGAGAVVMTVDNAAALRTERDAALTARYEAETAQTIAEEERRHADNEAAKARAVANFYLDLVQAAAPAGPDGKIDFFAVLREQTATARAHFAPNLAWAVEIEAEMAQTLRRRGRYDEAVALAERALTLQREVEDPIPTATALLLRVLATSKAKAGDIAGAISLMREAIAVYGDVNVPVPKALSAAQFGLGRFLEIAGEHAEAEQSYSDAIRTAEVANLTDGGLASRSRLAGLRAARGEVEQAEQDLLEVLSAAQAMDSPNATMQVTQVLGQIYADAGRHAEAVEQYRHYVAASAIIFIEGNSELGLAQFKLAQALDREGSDKAAAEKHFEMAVSQNLGGLERPWALQYLGLLARDRGDLEASAKRFSQSQIEWSAVLPPTHPQHVVINVHHMMALRAGGHVDAAREALALAVGAAERASAAANGSPPNFWRHMLDSSIALDREATTRAGLQRALESLRGALPPSDATTQLLDSFASVLKPR